MIYPINLMMQTCSVYIMVMITLERWVAVCRPLQVRVWCTPRKSRNAILVSIVSAFLYNFVRFFEYRFVSTETGAIYEKWLRDPGTHRWETEIRKRSRNHKVHFSGGTMWDTTQSCTLSHTSWCPSQWWRLPMDMSLWRCANWVKQDKCSRDRYAEWVIRCSTRHLFSATTRAVDDSYATNRHICFCHLQHSSISSQRLREHFSDIVPRRGLNKSLWLRVVSCPVGLSATKQPRDVDFSWLYMSTKQFWNLLQSTRGLAYWLNDLSNLLVVLNSGTTFIIYFTFSEKYRQTLIFILK